MNKILKLFFIISLNLLFADQEAYQKVTGYHYNDVWKSMNDFSLDIRYDIGEDKVYIYIPEFIHTVAYELDKEDRQKLITILEKYFEWQNKAIEMEVELEKNIDDVVLKGYFKLGDDWRSSCKKSCLIRLSFFSQNTTRHQLVFSFGKINACYNEYSDHKPDQVYMDYNDAIILKSALTQEKLQSVINEVEKKKSIEDAFK
jgi:hypothetical protein